MASNAVVIGDSRLCSQSHLHDEVFGHAQACYCCCCEAAAAAAAGAMVMTSQLEDERARHAVDVTDDQSGIESGQDRNHCCSAQHQNLQQQQQQHHQRRQVSCDNSKLCSDSSFETADAKISSQPGHGSVRGRRQRRCSQGNCAEREICVDDRCPQRQDGENCVAGESVESDPAMVRMVKKCSLDGSCGPDRSFQSVQFETAPRWSCGVPGLGASIQQVRLSHHGI